MSLAYTADPSRPRPGGPPAPIALSREAFLRHWRGDQVSTLRIAEHVSAERGGGYTVDQRPYVPVRCHCTARGCLGWIMVHDDPAAIAYFEALFGAPAQGRLL